MSYGSDVGRIMRSGLRHWPKVTLVALVTALDTEEGVASVARLARLLDASEDTVSRALGELRALGLVTVTTRPGLPSVYGVALETLGNHPLTAGTRSQQPPAHSGDTYRSQRGVYPLTAGGPRVIGSSTRALVAALLLTFL